MRCLWIFSFFSLIALLPLGVTHAQDNPLTLTQSYAGKAVSFTLPQNVLLQNGTVIVQDEVTRARKRDFVQALGAVDEAIARISRDVSNTVLDAALNARPAPVVNAAPPENNADVNLDDIGLGATTVAAQVFENPMVLPPETRALPFIEVRDYLKQALVSAKSNADRNKIREDLARLNITFGRYPEAIGILENFPVAERDGMPEAANIRILLGMAHALDGNLETALPLLTRSGEPRDHRLLWRAYATRKENPKDALILFTQNQTLLSSYPPMLDELLSRGYAEVLLQEPGRTEEIIPLFEKLAARLNGRDFMPESLYVLAKAYELVGDENRALRLLAETSESGDSLVAYRAKYEFVTNLQRRGELSNAATISALESLTRVWRGDALEEKILLDLGRLYLAEKDYRKALNYLKDYGRYYPQGDARQKVAYLMTQNFLSAFNERNALLTDDLGFLSLYYDFRELTPADERGDRLITRVAERLERLNLFSQARDLYEQQLTFRIEDQDERIKISLHLARLHLKNKNVSAALRVLNDIDLGLISQQQRNQVLLQQAKAHYARESFGVARTILNQLNTDAARDLLADIAWQTQDGATLITLIRPIFETGEHFGFEDAGVRNQFIRLTYAYAEQENISAINQLKRDYPDAINDYPDIADAVAFAIARAGADDVVASPSRSVGRLATELTKINELVANYKAVSAEVQSRKEERDLFNKKIRFMELRESGAL